MKSFLVETILAVLILGAFGNALVNPSSHNLPGINLLCHALAKVQGDMFSNDSYSYYQWGMAKIQAPEAWEIASGDSEVIIAVLDSGIDLEHPDLKDKIVASVNFASSDTDDDLFGHGSHVAGIAAASSDNEVGVAGLGQDCSLMNVKVLGDDGKGYTSWVAKGIRWAVDNGADVVNMSVVIDTPSGQLEKAVEYAWEHGAVVVAAAGNNGSTEPTYPAYYENCIAVGATDARDSLASFSNEGDWVDVAAPGVRIYSAVNDSNYGYKSGTSAAAPHVAGLAALLFPLVEDTNGNGRVNDEVREVIESTCDDLSGVRYGRINALRALKLA